MLWDRYRGVFLRAIPTGILGGSAVLVMLSLAGNSDFWRHQTVWGVLGIALTGAIIGTVSTLGALLGGWGAIAIRQRTASPARQETASLGSGTFGAGLGTLAIWLLVGLIEAIALPRATFGFGGWMFVGSVAAFVAMIMAAVLLARLDIRMRRGQDTSLRATGPAPRQSPSDE